MDISYLANPVTTAVARHVLDDHLRIAQLHTRHVKNDDAFIKNKGVDEFKKMRGSEKRGWHTDWPHDLSAYGNKDPNHNVGCIRQPFPDVAMCLVMIWYLTDTDENSGGTWVVPGSHKDKRNPRGPADDMTVTAPIPGDMQVTAPAGSVYIQDSRSWHASAMHNPSGRARVAVVNRWCPWWLSVDDFAPEEFGYKRTSDFNTGNNEGMGYFPLNVKNGYRCSAAVGYLNQVKKRKNLKILTNAHTKNIIFENLKAVVTSKYPDSIDCYFVYFHHFKIKL